MSVRRSIVGTAAGCVAAGLLLLLLLLPGCSGRVSSIVGTNQPPEIEIVDARADRMSGAGVRVRWAARDPDGRVKQSRWSLTSWGVPAKSASGTATTGSECVLPSEPLARTGEPAAVREPERFTLWAVDDAGAESKPVSLALFTNNVAPMVVITGPVPSALLRAQVPPNLCITWNGTDPDGIFTTKPVKYKYYLLDLDDPANQIFLLNPDSLRRLYAPSGWAGWDSTSADTEFVSFSNLVPAKSYLFVVTAFDEAGDYDPVFNLSKNMLQFTANFPQTLGPRLSLSTPTFAITYQTGGWFDDPLRAVHTEVAAGVPARFDWGAIPTIGQTITGFRWVLDPSSPHDQTPRSGPDDLSHWSPWSPVTRDVTLAPFSPAGLKREEHTLYIEARSNAGGCVVPGSEVFSLGIIHFVVVRPTHRRELLIVDDTRLRGDMVVSPGSCPTAHVGNWPTASELDTFLYARGGVPWRCTVNPTSGVITTGGLFAGYDFDTLGTRGRLSGQQYDQGGGQLVQTQSVPLSLLADYRHVLWITDGQGALNTNPINSPTSQKTAMRFMSEPGMVNVLSAYVRMGGKLWLAGATATASLLPWDRIQNNSGQLTRFSSEPQYNELGRGRLMWESAKLRSELSVTNALQASRALGRFEPAPGGYDALPLALQSRTGATDPLPPTRTISSQFYVSVRPTEFLTQPNVILEDIDPDPDIFDEQSVLDSLYVVQGSSVPIGTGNVAMTRYHGLEHGEVVWTGFDIWSFQRAQCISLVDAVLQGIWGLSRDPVARGPAGAPAAVSDASRPMGWSDRWRRAIATKR